MKKQSYRVVLTNGAEVLETIMYATSESAAICAAVKANKGYSFRSVHRW